MRLTSMTSLHAPSGRGGRQRIAALDAVVLRLVDDGDEPDDAPVAALPVPGEEREGDALARHGVKVAANVLDAEDPALEQDAMDGLPLGEVLLPVPPAGPFLVFLRQMRVERAVPVRADRGCERMVVGLGVVADDLDLLLDEPAPGGRHEAGALAEILLAVAIFVVPSGIDDDDVVRPHRLARRALEIVVADGLPHGLRDRDDDARAEEMRQRHLVDEGRILHDMRGRVDVGGVVHAGRDALRQHARLRDVMDALDLDVFEIGPVRRLEAVAMGEVVELEPHGIDEIALELDAPNRDRHSAPPVPSGDQPLAALQRLTVSHNNAYVSQYSQVSKSAS